jgi:hypothetical protein
VTLTLSAGGQRLQRDRPLDGVGAGKGFARGCGVVVAIPLVLPLNLVAKVGPAGCRECGSRPKTPPLRAEADGCWEGCRPRDRLSYRPGKEIGDA